MTIALILVAVLILIGIPISIYNRLVRNRNQIDNAFGAIDAMLKKRYDLLPNLVEAVKRYASHETQTLTQLTELRSGNQYDTLAQTDKNTFDSRFTAASRSFLALAEHYPDLKASENFMHLQRTLNETEEQLSAARRTYNAVVTTYNNSVMTFPSSIIAGIFHFQPAQVLEIPQEERKTPDLKKLFDN